MVSEGTPLGALREDTLIPGLDVANTLYMIVVAKAAQIRKERRKHHQHHVGREVAHEGRGFAVFLLQDLASRLEREDHTFKDHMDHNNLTDHLDTQKGKSSIPKMQAKKFRSQS